MVLTTGPAPPMEDEMETARATPRVHDAGVAAVLVAAVCVVWFGLFLAGGGSTAPGPDEQTRVFGDRPTTAEQMVSVMDGKHFAQLAVDPLYRHTVHGFRDDPPRASYRALRPFQGWVDWAASAGGQRPLLAPMMLVLAVVCTAALPLLLRSVAAALGRGVVLPAAVLAAPAILINLRAPGLCEPLGAGLALGGLAAWLRGRRSLAVALFCAAGLTRESMLAVPAGIALTEVVTRRRLRPALPLAVPVAVYAAWSAVARARVGPLDPTVTGDNGGWPLVGLIEGIRSWGPAEIVTAASLVVVLVLVARTREPVLIGIGVAHVALLAVLGHLVWMNWWGFGRVTLPLYGLALIGARLPADDPAQPSSPSSGRRNVPVCDDGVAATVSGVPSTTT